MTPKNLLSPELVRVSKTLANALRHRPDSLGIELNIQGWTDTATLLERLSRAGLSVSMEQLREVVTQNDKQRFAFSEDGRRIRASQGHSVKGVQLKLRQVTPPPVLFHGTTRGSMQKIMKIGLLPMQRHHVHLSPDVATAAAVGGRRGPPVILVIDAFRMHKDAHQFFLSENGVWLVETVPARYLSMK